MFANYLVCYKFNNGVSKSLVKIYCIILMLCKIFVKFIYFINYNIYQMKFKICLKHTYFIYIFELF